MSDRIFLDACMNITELSESQIYSLMKRGEFPKAEKVEVNLAPWGRAMKKNTWDRDEIQNWKYAYDERRAERERMPRKFFTALRASELSA